MTSPTSNKRTTFLVWLILIFALILTYRFSTRDDGPEQHAPFEQFLQEVDDGTVQFVRVVDNQIDVYLDGDRSFFTFGVMDDDVMGRLSEQAVRVEWGGEEDGWWSLLFWVLVVCGAVLIFAAIIQKRTGGGNNLFAMRRTTARRLEQAPAVTFDDVGGAEEAKARLRDVIAYLREPKRWEEAGVRFPRGVLLEGPPGCGKTLLARAVAGEAGVPFFAVSASEFVEMFVGVGAARVRDTFESAAKAAPAVVFIDELDAIGRRRGSGVGAGHDEREQTLNQLLVCLDGFDQGHRIVVLAATNRADILDPALLRAGRFDARVLIQPLTEAERSNILRIHTRDKKVADDATLDAIAARTERFTGADLERLANEAALLAVRRSVTGDGEPAITLDDLQAALDAHEGDDPRFDQVDALVIDSASQLTQPTGHAVVRMALQGGDTLVGRVEWADNLHVKIRSEEDGRALIVPKQQVLHVEALEGTDAADGEDLGRAPRAPGLA